jgi:hypothetical protein
LTTTLQASPKAQRFAHLLNAKRAKQDAEIQAAVEAYRREMEEREHTAPTYERMRKGDVQRKDVRNVGVRYMPRKDVVKQYSQKWRPEAEVAFMQLVADAEAADVKGVIINYHATGGRSAGDRMGGLGNAHASKIAALNRFTEVMESLPPRLQSLCKWLVLGECLTDGKAPTLEDVGRYIWGSLHDKRSCEMIGLGALIAVGDILVSAYYRYNVGHRFSDVRVPNMKQVGP